MIASVLPIYQMYSGSPHVDFFYHVKIPYFSFMYLLFVTYYAWKAAESLDLMEKSWGGHLFKNTMHLTIQPLQINSHHAVLLIPVFLPSSGPKTLNAALI